MKKKKKATGKGVRKDELQDKKERLQSARPFEVAVILSQKEKTREFLIRR